MTTVSDRYLTISEAAEAAGVPGKTPAAKAQALRRLERRGVVPQPPRAILSRDRYYTPELVERIALALTRHRMEEAA